MKTKPRWDVTKMAEDMAERGWNNVALARLAGVSDVTVWRFLNAKQQTSAVAVKLSVALGHPVRRYLIRSTAQKEVA